jgi:hypothetical protein
MTRQQGLTWMGIGLIGLVLLIFLGVYFLGPEKSGKSKTRDPEWKKVDQALQKGLPQTAIQYLESIVERAQGKKAYGQAIKGISTKIALEGTIQGNRAEERITRMQAEIAKAPPEMQPLMQAILAHWYWQYFQNNRRRYLERTARAGPAGNDILTWDLPRILAEIDKQFSAALAPEDQLKKKPSLSSKTCWARAPCPMLAVPPCSILSLSKL